MVWDYTQWFHLLHITNKSIYVTVLENYVHFGPYIHDAL